MEPPDAALTATPPPAALAWVAAETGRPVSRVSPLAGARSSALHAVTLDDGRTSPVELVLRRYLDAAWLAREPDLARSEADVLVVLEASEVPTPRLVAVDPTGARAGAPAVLMTRLPGAVAAKEELPARLGRLAEVLPLLHATPVPSHPRIRSYRPYYLDSPELVPPAWTTRPDVWHRAIAVHRAWSASDAGVLVHRDFHPDNVLFTGTRVSGLVDWANASVGPPDVDVGHCRLNLALFVDLEAADRFRDRWLIAAGRDRYDTSADVLALVGLLPDWPPGPLGAEAVELMLERALRELGA